MIGQPRDVVCDHDGSPGHDWQRVHHYDDQLAHYCPTGFDECDHCGEWRETPDGEAVCQKWAET
jgi:hypothetical protein